MSRVLVMITSGFEVICRTKIRDKSGACTAG